MREKASKRVGRFTMTTDWARQFSTDAKRVMGLCVVVRAEQLFHSAIIEYIAISEHFREVATGEVVPEYVWNFTSEGEISTKEVKREHN